MHRPPIRHRWLAIAVVFIAGILVGQRIISFSKISVNDGLGQSSIGYIIQDSRGYMWIGTDDGLCRYDGYDFKVYRPDPRDSTTIISQRVGMLYEDPQQYIWIGTKLGIERYNPRTDRFEHFLNDMQEDISIFSAIYQSETLMWVASSLGLFLLDPTTGNYKSWTHVANDSTTIPSNLVFGIAATEGGLLVGTYDGLCFMDKNDHLTSWEWCGIKNCRSILNANGKIFVAGNDAIYQLHSNPFRFQLLDSSYYEGPRGGFSPGGVINATFDHDDQFWMGGWMQLAPVTISYTGLTHLTYYTNGVWPSGSGAIAIDHSKNIWVGGEATEILTGNLSSSRFLSYRIEREGQASQDINSVWSCAEDTTGCIFIGAQASVNRLDPRTGKIKQYKRDPENPRSITSNGGCFNALRDSKGRIWFDADRTLCKYNYDTDDFDRYGVAQGHPEKNVSITLESNDGMIWLGSGVLSLTEFNPETNKFTIHHVDTVHGGITYPSIVRSMSQDIEGTIWVGTNTGVYSFDPVNNIYHSVIDEQKWHSEFHAVVSAGPGLLWIASNVHGLLKLDIAKKEVIRQYRDIDGLANNCVYDIVIDNEGILWLSTNMGLSRFDPVNETFRNYDYSDGLQHNEFSGGGGTLTPSGWIYFGCADGLTAFRPDHMDDNPIPPKVLITKLSLFNKPVGIVPSEIPVADSVPMHIMESDTSYSIPIDISFVQNLELDYDQNFLQFDFVAFHYASPEKNTYAYIMEGLEGEWNEAGTKRNATYTNIPPGDYTFRVKAANSDGVWNEEGKSIHIVVNPPWWETLWFRLMAVIALVAAIVGFFRYRTGALRRDKLILERTVRERTNEVVQQKHMVEEKQKEIIDSINYAQRIQRALLASDKLLENNLGDHFVLFQPKDIVAGDFYWGTVIDDGFMLITADCTGHGVPGAFMSLLNISKLSETIIEKKITSPDLVLNNVRTEIVRSLNPNAGDNSQDGMDCVLCKIDLKNRKLKYAAANNSFYIVRNNELINCTGDKMPVGKSHDENSFSLHSIDLKPGDVIYTLTDGYPDQFGGPRGKKFKYKQLEELLLKIAHLSMSEQRTRLEVALNDWRGNLEQVDDICIIGVRVP